MQAKWFTCCETPACLHASIQYNQYNTMYGSLVVKHQPASMPAPLFLSCSVTHVFQASPNQSVGAYSSTWYLSTWCMWELVTCILVLVYNMNACVLRLAPINQSIHLYTYRAYLHLLGIWVLVYLVFVSLVTCYLCI